MTELEIFVKDIIEQGGEFWTLETCTRGKLAKTITHYKVKNDIYNEVRYQVFNADGKRVFVDVNYYPALTYYNTHIKEV